MLDFDFQDLNLDSHEKGERGDFFLRRAVENGDIEMNLNLGVPGDNEVMWQYGTFRRDAFEEEINLNRNAIYPGVGENLWKKGTRENPVMPYTIKDSKFQKSLSLSET